MAIAFRLRCMEDVDRLFHPPSSSLRVLLTASLATCYWIHSFRQLPPNHHSSPHVQARHQAIMPSQLHRPPPGPLPLCDISCIRIDGESHVPLLSVLCAAFCASVRISKTRSSIALKPDRSMLVLLKLDNAFWSSSTASSGET